MDFEFRQVSGPRLGLGVTGSAAGTVRTIVFRQRGRYVLSAKNVQTSEELALETLGPDNALTLTVLVK